MERDEKGIEDLSALSAKADLARSGGDWAVAAAAYQELVRHRPGEMQFKYELARSYGELGRRRDVIELLKGPSAAGFEKAKRMLAMTYIEAKNYSAAAPLVDELLAAVPNDLKVGKWKSLCDSNLSAEKRMALWMNRAEAYYSADRLQEA